MSKTTEELAKKLHGMAVCPECGYELKRNDEVVVSDWNLIHTRCVFTGWGLRTSESIMTETRKGEEEVECPECGASTPIEKWGGLK